MKTRFELFESVCSELVTEPERIVTEAILPASLREDLAEEEGASTDDEAIRKAFHSLDLHFSSRGSPLPFEYDPATGRCAAVDTDYLQFIADARSIRGSALPAAKRFEIAACTWLSRRLTGLIHLVGSPRKRQKKRADFVRYLKQLGFDENVLDPNDKDGGFDIIWLPPLGAIPLRPIVSVQCKNSSFAREEAMASVGQAVRSIQRHSHMTAAATYMACVVFNDYIDESYLGRAKGWGVRPLGTERPRLATRSRGDGQSVLIFSTMARRISHSLPAFEPPTAARSANMRAIRSSGNLTTERRLMALLRRQGLRGWRLHPPDIFGAPDLVIQDQRIAIFVDGCFWHGCPKCGHIPKKNSAYWRAKIARNRARDERISRRLRRLGFSVIRLRECDLRVRQVACLRRVQRLLKCRSPRE